MLWTHAKEKHHGDHSVAPSFKAIPCHPEVLYSSNLVAHLIVIVGLVFLTAHIFLIIILVILHIISGDLGVVDDLAACASATLDDVALVDGVIEVVLCVFFLI